MGLITRTLKLVTPLKIHLGLLEVRLFSFRELKLLKLLEDILFRSEEYNLVLANWSSMSGERRLRFILFLFKSRIHSFCMG